MEVAVGDPHSSSDHQLSQVIGPWGLFQSLMFAYDCLAMLAMGAHNLLFVVMAPNDADYWCQRPADSALSDEQWKSANIPRDASGKYDHCTVFGIGNSGPDGHVNNATLIAGAATVVPTPARVLVHCSAWDFNQSTSAGTILEEWSLVCENRWLPTYSAAVYMSGSFVGLIIAGLFSDRIGRRPVIFAASVILECSGLAVQSARSFYIFTALRFVVSCSVTSIFFVSFVLVIETVETSMRGFCGMFVEYGFAASTLVVLGIGWFRPSWRLAQLAIMLPTSLLLTCFLLVVESPRWLYATSNSKLAPCAIAEIHRTNKMLCGATRRECSGSLHRIYKRGSTAVRDSGTTQRQSTTSDVLPDQQSRSEAYVRDVRTTDQLRILMSKELRIVNVGIVLAWFVGTMTFYGLALGFRSNARSNALATVVVLAAPMVGYVGIEYMGRVPTLAATQIICGVICFAHSARLTGYMVESLFVEMTAWFWVNITLDIMFLYGVEAYPTTVRCLGYCLSAAVGRLGNVAAPIIMTLVRDHGADGPYLVMAFASVVSGMLTLYMPETLAKQLPENKDLFKFLPMHQIYPKKSSGKGSQRELSLEWPVTPFMTATERFRDTSRSTLEELWAPPVNEDKSNVSEKQEDHEAMLLQSVVGLPAFLENSRKTASKDNSATLEEQGLTPLSAKLFSEAPVKIIIPSTATFGPHECPESGTSALEDVNTESCAILHSADGNTEGSVTVSAKPMQPETSVTTYKRERRSPSKGSRTSIRRSQESLPREPQRLKTRNKTEIP